MGRALLRSVEARFYEAIDLPEPVLDLGCGDGRLVTGAAKKYGCRGVGFDIDPERVKEARAKVIEEGVEDLVRITEADIFTLDLSEADQDLASTY